MFLLRAIIIGAVSGALAFSPDASSARTTSTTRLSGESQTTRTEFVAGVAIAAASSTLLTPQVAAARGRATLEQAYDRYVPRIIDGGAFYKKELYGAVAKGDWKAIELATQEPPKKSKADRALADGGVARRAAMAGGFSDARVLSAMDLFASTFSESSISAKTKGMKAEVETLRTVVKSMQAAAVAAQSEGGGGLFSKKQSKSELAKELQSLYVKGGNAYNQYCYLLNDGLPISLKKVPFL